MRRELRQPRLQYTSVINQGDHMIELPVDFRGVPKVRALVPGYACRAAAKCMCWTLAWYPGIDPSCLLKQSPSSAQTYAQGRFGV